MAKGQLSIEALIALAAFFAALAVLISVCKSAASDAKASAAGISAQAEADAAALRLNLLAGDGTLSSISVALQGNCGLSSSRDAVSCTEKGSTRSAKLITGTDSWREYGTYPSIPS